MPVSYYRPHFLPPPSLSEIQLALISTSLLHPIMRCPTLTIPTIVCRGFQHPTLLSGATICTHNTRVFSTPPSYLVPPFVPTIHGCSAPHSLIWCHHLYPQYTGVQHPTLLSGATICTHNTRVFSTPPSYLVPPFVPTIQGCSAPHPLIWCHHLYPQYRGVQHPTLLSGTTICTHSTGVFSTPPSYLIPPFVPTIHGCSAPHPLIWYHHLYPQYRGVQHPTLLSGTTICTHNTWVFSTPLSYLVPSFVPTIHGCSAPHPLIWYHHLYPQYMGVQHPTLLSGAIICTHNGGFFCTQPSLCLHLSLQQGFFKPAA